MIPVKFPEANSSFGPPEGMSEAQVATVAAFVGEMKGGTLDGARLVVTAWMPTAEELEQLIQGGPLFLTVVGGLPPHCITTDFKEATNLG